MIDGPSLDMASSIGELPNEMFFKAASSTLAPRLGRLSFPGRQAIDTPHYLAITSRGVVPHLTQDSFARDTRIAGVYVGLEDCRPSLPPGLHPSSGLR